MALGTPAAVKRLKRSLDPDELALFRREAQLMARLSSSHPPILPVLDDDGKRGQPCLVLAYAPGGTHRQRHPPGTRMPLETEVASVQQVASALQEAPEQQPPVGHRDIKPHKMLIGRQGEMLLSDVGSATLVPQDVHPRARAGTAPSMARGSFEEQCTVPAIRMPWEWSSTSG